MTTEELYQQANEITDGLGMHVDEGIKKILVGLWSNELQTSGSCEGHKNRGLPFPWVDIETDDPKGWENSRLHI